MYTNQKKILSFWKDIEIFHLPDLSSKDKIVKVTLTEPLPWLSDSKDTDSKKYYIFLGKRTKESIIDVIENLTKSKSKEKFDDEKVPGNTFMAMIVVNGRGELLKENAYLQPTYIYGIKCLQNEQPLSSINKLLEEGQEKFNERHSYISLNDNSDENNISKSITWADLENEIGVLNDIGINGISCNHDIYILTIDTSKQSKDNTAFLNSFFVDDLNLLINEKDSFGKGLDSYLLETVHEEKRIDLLKNDPKAFFETIDPLKIPAGRWPSNPTEGLYTAQAGAVNTATSLLKDSGIIGINGPPGTGKTKLLGDVIAEVVVLRAQKLIQQDISTLFKKGVRKEKEGGKYSYHFPVNSDAFIDAGIVVASNNNTAVENISKELPSLIKINSDSFPNAAYFTKCSNGLLKKDDVLKKDDDLKKDVWGLIAVPLGKSDNINSFKNNIWYKKDLKDTIEKDLKDTISLGEFWKSVYENPENIDRTNEYISLFEKTKTELELLLREFNSFKKNASIFNQLLPEYLNDKKLEIKLDKEIAEIIVATKSFYDNKQAKESDLEVLKNRILEIELLLMR